MRLARCALAVVVLAGCPAKPRPSGPDTDTIHPVHVGSKQPPITPEQDARIRELAHTIEAADERDAKSVEAAVIAADELGRTGRNEAVPALAKAATQTFSRLSAAQQVRLASIRALGNFEDARATTALVACLQASLDEQPLQINAAAANALSEKGDPRALQPLLLAAFSMPPIYMQVRRAITRIGDRAVPELAKIFQGKHEALEAFAREQGFAEDCERASGAKTRCKAPGNLRFKSAMLLGDLRARVAVPLLVAALGEPDRVAFYDPATGTAGPTSHLAILEALRQIGDPAAADAVLAYAQKATGAVAPQAIDVYSMLTADTAALGYLAKRLADDHEDDIVRQAAALAYGRLVREAEQLKPLEAMIAWHKKAAAKLDKHNKPDEAEAHRAAIRALEDDLVRARVGIECQADADCYAGYLDKGGTEQVERALLELGKMGAKARPVLPALLARADATDRVVRQGVLLALTRVAQLPCKPCVDRLTEVIDQQKDQPTLDLLTGDTRVVLHYFLSAMRRPVPVSDESLDPPYPVPALGANGCVAADVAKGYETKLVDHGKKAFEEAIVAVGAELVNRNGFFLGDESKYAEQLDVEYEASGKRFAVVGMADTMDSPDVVLARTKDGALHRIEPKARSHAVELHVCGTNSCSYGRGAMVKVSSIAIELKDGESLGEPLHPDYDTWWVMKSFSKQRECGPPPP